MDIFFGNHNYILKALCLRRRWELPLIGRPLTRQTSEFAIRFRLAACPANPHDAPLVRRCVSAMTDRAPIARVIRGRDPGGSPGRDVSAGPGLGVGCLASVRANKFRVLEVRFQPGSWTGPCNSSFVKLLNCEKLDEAYAALVLFSSWWERAFLGWDWSAWTFTSNWRLGMVRVSAIHTR